MIHRADIDLPKCPLCGKELVILAECGYQETRQRAVFRCNAGATRSTVGKNTEWKWVEPCGTLVEKMVSPKPPASW